MCSSDKHTAYSGLDSLLSTDEADMIHEEMIVYMQGSTNTRGQYRQGIKSGPVMNQFVYLFAYLLSN